MIFYRKIFRVSELEFDSIGMINGGNTATGLRDRLEMDMRNA